MLSSQQAINYSNRVLAGYRFTIHNTESLNTDDKYTFRVTWSGKCLIMQRQAHASNTWHIDSIIERIDPDERQIELFTCIMYEIIERKLSFKDIKFIDDQSHD